MTQTPAPACLTKKCRSSGGALGPLVLLVFPIPGHIPHGTRKHKRRIERIFYGTRPFRAE